MSQVTLVSDSEYESFTQKSGKIQEERFTSDDTSDEYDPISEESQ